MARDFYVHESSLEDKSTLIKFTYQRLYEDPKFYVKYVCLFEKTLRIPRFDYFILGNFPKMIES